MDNHDLDLGHKAVRIFYYLVLKHVIPHNPTASPTDKRGAQSDKQREVEFCESLNHQLEVLLEPQDFQIAFDRKTGVRPFEEQQPTYLIPFLVSKVCEFKADDIIIPKPGSTKFKVETMALSSVRETWLQDIRDALCSKVAIHELDFSMATSRSFVFEIYYEGSFRVEREFSDDDIESAGGVRDALELFFDEIESAIEPFGVQVTSTPPRHRRSRDNEYLFGVYFPLYIGFSESDVHGAGCYAISADSSTDEINEYGVDFADTLVDDGDAFLSSFLDGNLSPNADLISSKISYVYHSKEAFDIYDELIFSHQSYSEDSMLERPESELQIVTPRDPLPTVEVDIDSIPEGLHGYSDLVTRALTSVAEKTIKLKATIYVYQGTSINFHHQSWSAFFGVAGEKKLLDVLLNAFREAKVNNARFSDYIDPSTATREFHVQDGHVWRPLDACTWYTESQDDTDSAEDAVTETDVLDNTASQDNGCASRTATPSRFRIARSDATVGTISKKIEEVFGLPEGAVALRGPNRRALRGDAKIATLRRRWGE
jgi:hypothetical protein